MNVIRIINVYSVVNLAYDFISFHLRVTNDGVLVGAEFMAHIG